jgi:hypothetical protein
MLALPLPVQAGTKYLSNLVPLSNGAPTLSSKSRVLLKEQGSIKAKLKDVKGAAGVTADGDQVPFSGDEYVVVLIGSIPAVDIDFELNLVVEMKSGNGSVKSDTSALINLIPTGLVRSIVIDSTEVHGPLGAPNATACKLNIANADGISFPPAANPCVGGNFIGQAGIDVPQ